MWIKHYLVELFVFVICIGLMVTAFVTLIDEKANNERFAEQCEQAGGVPVIQLKRNRCLASNDEIIIQQDE